MFRNTTSMAALLLALSLGFLGAGQAGAASKSKAKTTKRVTTTKKATADKGASTTNAASTTAPPTSTSAPTTAPAKTAAPKTTAVSDTTPAPPVPAAGGITIQGFAFVNSPISVKAGAPIVITNLDNTEHTVTADDGSSFGTDAVRGNKTATLTVSKAGTFTFHCNIHPSMKGTLVVS